MNELIDRQAAIRWVKTECNPYGKPTLDFESGKKVIEHLEKMPCSQPEIIACGQGELVQDGLRLVQDLISRQAAIEELKKVTFTMQHPVLGCDLKLVNAENAIDRINALPPAQPEPLTDDDFETIRIHLNAYKEKLCNQRRWKEAEEYQRIIDRFMAFASAQPEPRWVPWEKLERYAEFFCADVPYTEFVREAKQFFLTAERSEE